MSYNIVSIISIVITALLALLFSHYLSLVFFEDANNFRKIVQLIIAIVVMTTFYAPIKYILLKYMGINEKE
ncbi:hypothetical protein CRV00_03725 [Malaciobacter molluscorum]|uniref:hypothetical protein n=1 Tax=Malaciobacter molluscorum TaxID=1032072 RepID=UPI00100ABD74|nr:hypothetical protein [Malaciobacter molluscorum]RXJ95564.1 hypothetical protein CRV00_03725 [Malaciobacter molluscorum]